MFEGPQSGKFGVLHNVDSAITHLFRWNLETSISSETYYASNTRWGANRNPSIKDWNGSFSIYDGSSVINPGDFLLALEFFTAPTSGVYGNVGTTYCGQAIVESNTITLTWGDEGTLIQEVSIAANGCLAPRNRVIDDTGIATPARMCGLGITYDYVKNPSTFYTLNNVQQAVLTMTSSNPMFVNSSTGCCAHRRPGNIDWNLVCTLTDHRASLFDELLPYSFRLYNTTTTYWELSYAQYQGATGIIVDRSTGEIQQQQVSFGMKAIYDDDVGNIITPATTTIWPVSSTTDSVPDAPTNVAGSEDSAWDVTVTWTAPAAGETPTGYTIWASKNGVDYACVGRVAHPTATYDDIGIMAADDYYYKVAAYNAQGQGPFSSASDAVTVDGT